MWLKCQTKRNQFNERAHDQESVNEIPGEIPAGEEGATTSENPEQQLDSEDHHEASLRQVSPRCNTHTHEIPTTPVPSKRRGTKERGEKRVKRDDSEDNNARKERKEREEKEDRRVKTKAKTQGI